MKQTLSKRPGLHISWHITDVLPQLRRQLIRTFMKGKRRMQERERGDGRAGKGSECETVHPSVL